MMITPNDLSFGVEIETVGRTREQVAEAIRCVVGGQITYAGGVYQKYVIFDRLGRYWSVVRDSSLRNVESPYQSEVVTPPLMLSDMDELQQVVRSVRECGARVDEKCGIHVHVDASQFNGAQLANLCKLIHAREKQLVRALGVQAERIEYYSKLMHPDLLGELQACRPQTREEMQSVWYSAHESDGPTEHYDDSRYYGLNLHSVFYRGTVEFRYFEATLHAGKVKAYVHLALALVCKALNSSRISAKPKEIYNESEKFDFRCFLLQLGMIGDEYKTTRKHLLELLGGSNRHAYRPLRNEEANAALREVVEEATGACERRNVRESADIIPPEYAEEIIHQCAGSSVIFPRGAASLSESPHCVGDIFDTIHVNVPECSLHDDPDNVAVQIEHVRTIMERQRRLREVIEFVIDNHSSPLNSGRRFISREEATSRGLRPDGAEATIIAQRPMVVNGRRIEEGEAVRVGNE